MLQIIDGILDSFVPEHCAHGKSDRCQQDGGGGGDSTARVTLWGRDATLPPPGIKLRMSRYSVRNLDTVLTALSVQTVVVTE